MTATHGASASDAASDGPDYASLCDQARDLAESGHLKRAAQVYEQVLAGEDPRYRARAALGLAVVRHDSGDVGAAREADLIAIGTGHPEFAPRAAYHLAVSYEGAGADQEAREAWRRVLDFGNNRYTPAAHHGLARLAEERGDVEGARGHWERVLAADEAAIVPEAARDYAERLLARGAVDAAADVVHRGLAVGEHPGLRMLLGAVHVEWAIGEFGAAVADAGDAARDGVPVDPGTAGAAVELLARLLAVRGDADGAGEAWEHGLAHPVPEVGDEVRARLRRGFLAPDPESAERAGADGDAAAAWWDPYIEAAVAQDNVPLLTGELFLAVNQIYTRLAVPLAGNETHAAVLREAIEQAVRTPGEYVWGRALHDDFRERLRRAAGSGADVLPEGWPDA
ncbi:tetratricopeptide (TPR) repeat protein [Spinactinospora alkalitolerans]|uniref:Tetratricopeptide (TPR) repeat protein n=1 Tax=Spinactinospora alkalitolerans TaxID=687207 RepID=A0A852TY80_9ACTN|nr:hypothetical protein [Spinactinospora alkalitolerans]NYE48295.1 tetratricopeptide (TPR) repeat protein [Spinactinospora alkalitolerans]